MTETNNIDATEIPKQITEAAEELKKAATSLKEAGDIIADSKIPVKELLVGGALGLGALAVAMFCKQD